MFEYIENTKGVIVSVRPLFIPEQSDIMKFKYVFRYNVKISNQTDQSFQLMTRSWLIRDNIGEQYEIKGDGVIGKQPLIEPNTSFTYQSFCVLKSPSGSMEGYYLLHKKNGDSLKITIPKFYLNADSLN